VDRRASTARSITYDRAKRPPPEAIAALYGVARLDRPIDDLDRIRQMYRDSSLVVTAWVGDELIGILRGWSDSAYLGYIADLAVHPDRQRQGIGRRLLKMAVNPDRRVQFVLRAAPTARDYYAHIGWRPVGNAWYWSRTN
jgi:GNAT superfamily N-acetyltransferase